MNKYQNTLDTWDKVAEQYEDKFMQFSLYNPSYDAFISALPQEASILDLGCGPGNITQYLIHQNPLFAITAMDASPNMILRAKINVPQANFIVQDIRHIRLLGQKFEGIIGGFCLPYLNPYDAAKLINDCSDSLDKNGVLYLSFVLGKNNNETLISDGEGNEMYFYTYTQQFVLGQLKGNDFEPINNFIFSYKNAQGNEEKHIAIIANKRSQ